MPFGRKKETVVSIVKEIDQLKFRIDELSKQEIPVPGLISPEGTEIVANIEKIQIELITLKGKLDKFDTQKAGMATSEFKTKRQQEVSRIKTLSQRLVDIKKQLEPDEIEDDYLRNAGGMDDETEEEEDEEEDQNEDDDDGDLDEDYADVEDTKEISQSPERVVHYVVALSDFKKEQPSDLQFSVGDIIAITDANEDGWWTGHKDGESGSVPSTLVKNSPTRNAVQ